MARSYLTAAQLDGFRRYKYSSRDTSPLAVYIMHPFWNNAVKIFPTWLAPNVMTFLGWVLTVAIFIVLCYYDPYLVAAGSRNGHHEQYNIPQWIWIYIAIAHFSAHTLDGCDGKQARRTNSSSPLGELFDHGIDSMAIWLIGVCVFSIFGQGPLSLTMWEYHWIVVVILIGFYVAHWEKYITGVLFLPWAYDFSQLTLLGIYLSAHFFGINFWKFPLYKDIYLTHVFKWIAHSSFFCCFFPLSLYNIYRSKVEKTDRGLSLGEALKPGIPLFTCLSLFTLWAWYSPSNILQAHPRLFFTSLGIVFSNATCRLIVSTMSHQKCEIFNYMLIPLIFINIAVFLVDFNEVYVLAIYTLIIGCAHVDYGVGVVNEMCNMLRIRCFSLKPL
ncbi:ethanolaminephosphotransferase 1-like [Dendronephthya gigantea]|uniref:ethanolaminephosphotransferase 1-like n=1 Tax=Dendronephthya gigantea TaxID=151771 RepID=UPI0010690CE9|nr:ethanolaminephosphotransferase 1-like [Dendronephthya gigantea]